MDESRKNRLLKAVFIRGGDLSGLTTDERWEYYLNVCEELGLNPSLQPFQLVEAYDAKHRQNRLMLYLTKGGADQLRRKFNISTRIVSTEFINDGRVFQVIVEGRMGERIEMNIGTASLAEITDRTASIKSERIVNSHDYAKGIMMACTRALRRLTISMVGLGVSDESELSLLPNSARVDWGIDNKTIREDTRDDLNIKRIIRRGNYEKLEEQSVNLQGEKTEDENIAQESEDMEGVPAMTDQQFMGIFDVETLADVTEEELACWDKDYYEIHELIEKEKQSPSYKEANITSKTLNYLYALEKYYPAQGDRFKKWLKYIFNVESRKQLKQYEASALIKYLNKIKEGLNE